LTDSATHEYEMIDKYAKEYEEVVEIDGFDQVPDI
jgi:hypothetical protein